jgi:hypothetical protein
VDQQVVVQDALGQLIALVRMHHNHAASVLIILVEQLNVYFLSHADMTCVRCVH